MVHGVLRLSWWQDVSAFLLIRGPFAHLGFSWSGCNVEGYGGDFTPAQLKVLEHDYGEPVDATCR